MARFDVTGNANALIAGLDDMIAHTPQLRDEILEAEADVIEAHIGRSFSGGNLVNTGKLKQSIARKKHKNAIYIGPTGVHHTYQPSDMRLNVSGIVTNGYVGYIHEFGIPSRGIRARKWMSKAVDGGKGEAYAAADKVYDAFLKKHNL